MEFNDRRPGRPRIEWSPSGNSFAINSIKNGQRHKRWIKVSSFDEEADPDTQEALGRLYEDSKHGL